MKREIQEELGIDCNIVRFLGLVEHKWESKGKLNCEINQVFEVDCPSLHLLNNPTSKESHLEFFWSPIDDLDSYNLKPYPLRDLIANFNNLVNMQYEN
ncbi:NUDIX domain-containing protein [Thermoflavimicrobium daqui]|uniref:NUDIX domain-containing protein n=1 Tax=Thermoflavimicrobium daqui TaxID=2137476 RepID=UPI001F0C9DC5|nr:NUDIX domain-containing protein [Thermoflavimicrobium daqui]